MSHEFEDYDEGSEDSGRNLDWNRGADGDLPPDSIFAGLAASEADDDDDENDDNED